MSFNPSDSFRVLLVDPDGVAYSIGSGALGTFDPSNSARVVLVDIDGVPYKATGGGGGGTPGGAFNSVQFNNAGSFGGFGSWNGTTLQIPGAANSLNLAGSTTGNPVTITATGSDADIPIRLVSKGIEPTIIGGPASNFFDPYTGNTPLTYAKADLIVGGEHTEIANSNSFGSLISLSINPPADSFTSIHCTSSWISIPPANNKNLSSIYGMESVLVNNGSGTLTAFYGVYADVAHYGSGEISNLWGMFVNLENTTGHVFNAYSYEAGQFYIGGTTDNLYQYHSVDIAGAATNGYYSWFDSRGVLRVKEDNSFDSVGQAITALYNPQFAKYVAGATDFERIVLSRWNGNVAEIGTEKGGTGTLRALRLIGSSYKLAALTNNGFVKTSGGDGTLSVDTTTYLTAASAVTSLAKSGSTALVGAVTLTGGSNVTLTQVGQDISIAAAGGSSGATTALDNLASVSINSALLAQTGIDLGSTTKPFRDLYLFGSGTFASTYLKLTGTPTSTRTVTFPDASITVARTDAAQTFTGNQTFTGSRVNTGEGFQLNQNFWLEFASGGSFSNIDPTFGMDGAVNSHTLGLFARDLASAMQFNVYGKFDGNAPPTNYERAALSTQQGASITLAAETGGTGGDDLDIIFTPAGTGKVRFGSFVALGVEVGAGTISIKDSGGTTRKLLVVA